MKDYIMEKYQLSSEIKIPNYLKFYNIKLLKSHIRSEIKEDKSEYYFIIKK